MDEFCVVCGTDVEPLKTTTRGIDTLIEYSKKLQDDRLERFLQKKLAIDECVKIHRDCQKKAYNVLKRKSLKTEQPVYEAKKTRSSIPSFTFNSNCLFCGILVRKDSKHPDRNPTAIIRTLPFRDKILNICNDRKDDWAEDVQLRTMSCSDLVAAGAIYHYNCY